MELLGRRVAVPTKRAVARYAAIYAASVMAGLFITLAVPALVFGIEKPWGFASSGSMEPAYMTGDFIVIDGRVPFDRLAVGDVIAFEWREDRNRVIHRIVEIHNDGTVDTKGDANSSQLPLEMGITEEMYVGRVVYKSTEIGQAAKAFREMIGAAGRG